MTARFAVAFLLSTAALFGGTFQTSQAAPSPRSLSQELPPIVFEDDRLNLFPFWNITTEVSAGATYSVTQQTSGGNPDDFRFMSHRLPPVAGQDLASVVTTHIYYARYSPRFDGEIRAIDYQEDGIILSFPFVEAFSTTQPVIEQNGRLFRATQFIRFIAQNFSHAWETKTLNQLTADDFVAVDGSGHHPDFRVSGADIRFGFTRSNFRSSTLPPVPSSQEMVIDQGVDNWQVVVYRDGTALPPNAADDTFVLDGNQRSLPLLEFFDVVRNDRDANLDRLEIATVSEPLYGSADKFSNHTVVYQLEEARATDTFAYTVIDGALTDEAQVQVLIDCACTALCLSSLEVPEVLTAQAADEIDLPLIYQVRDWVLKPTAHGRRYVEMYYTGNPEILATTFMSETLRAEALAGVLLWQEPLRSLVEGDGSAVITQTEIDALQSYLDHLSDAASPQLQWVIASEMDRLGPLDDFVGLSVKEAKRRAIGDPTVYLPLITLAQ